MNTTETTQHSKTETPHETKGPEKRAAFADSLVDLGLAWADMGIGLGKTALENTARALERSAKYLETVQGRLKSQAHGGEAQKPSA